MNSTKATIYVCEIKQQLALGYIVRGVHIVMFTMSFVNSLLCGPPTLLVYTTYFTISYAGGLLPILQMEILDLRVVFGVV